MNPIETLTLWLAALLIWPLAEVLIAYSRERNREPARLRVLTRPLALRIRERQAACLSRPRRSSCVDL